MTDVNESASVLPGSLEIGNDGARERIVLDLRGESPRVMLADIVCSGWDDAFLQASSLEEFVTSIDQGRFEFRFE